MRQLIEIFYAPGKVFEDVRDRKLWAPAFIANVMLVLILSYAIVNMIGSEELARKQIESRPNMTPEQVEQAMRVATSPTVQIVQTVGIPIAIAIVTLIEAGLLLLIFNMTARRLQFTQVLGTVSYAGFQFTVLGTVMAILVVALSRDRGELNPQNLIASNAAAFMDKATTAKPLYAIAGSLDILTLGQIALLSYGCSKVAGISFTRALMIVGGLWLVWVLVKVGFSGFM